MSISHPNIPIIAITTIISLLYHPTFSIPTTTTTTATATATAVACKPLTTFLHCNNLPTLGATLHYTYNPTKTSLSMAFTARPVTPDGWVSWALNPSGFGMLGAQALIAFKPDPTGPISVDTYNIQSYRTLTKGPISYNVTAMSAVESSDGHVTILATWALPSSGGGGGEALFLNQVWQVGPVLGGKPGAHDYDQPNLNSVMKLHLTDDGPSRAFEPVSRGGPETMSPGPGIGLSGSEDLGSMKSLGLGLVLVLLHFFALS